MGCGLSKEVKIAAVVTPVDTQIDTQIDISFPLRIRIPKDVSKKEVAIRPIKRRYYYKSSYFRD